MTINDSDLARLVSFVREGFGINLEHKRQLIEARLSFDISRRGFKSFNSYVNEVILNPDGEECHRMINRLSTNYTYFFRESDCISHLCEETFPSFVHEGRQHIKIWCAACASGQEAYSVAMALEARRRFCEGHFDYEITATDINTDMLECAAKGIYNAAELENVPPQYHRFFNQNGSETVEISDTIKKVISWKYANLLDGAKDNLYDIVFCRNVMIYFTPQLRNETMRMLHSALLPDGILYTGATESIDFERRFFRYIQPSVYQKVER